jgi:tellurium resistance protein TerZ
MLHTSSSSISNSKLLVGTRISIGFCWDACVPTSSQPGIRSLDLDTTCLTYDAGGNLIDTVWFRNKTSLCGAIKHRGDDPCFVNDGEVMDEIVVDLNALSDDLARLVFIVNSLGPQKFDAVQTCSFELLDLSTQQVLASEIQPATGLHKAFMTFALIRTEVGWEFRSIGQSSIGRTMGHTAEVAAKAA